MRDLKRGTPVHLKRNSILVTIEDRLVVDVVLFVHAVDSANLADFMSNNHYGVIYRIMRRAQLEWNFALDVQAEQAETVAYDTQPV